MTLVSVCRLAPATIAAFLLASCSSDTPAPIPSKAVDPGTAAAATGAPAAGQAQPVTGKTAYWEMYKKARAWAPDITPLSLTSKKIPGMKNPDGKAAMWTAVFASASKHEVRRFSYAIAAAEGVVKGVEAEHAMAWGGPTREAMPFRMADVGTDSDAAYQTAYKKGEDWLKKHPNEEYTMTLGSASRFPAPVWYILWGNNKSGFNAWVNANSGAIAEGK